MTIEEANGFLREAFIAFPGVLQWVKDNSPDPKLTLQLWAKNLERISTAEAISVLNRWNANDIPPPSGYQRELFINHVIAVVQKDRSKTYAARHRDEVFEQLNLKQPKGNYNAVCGPCIRDVMGLKASYDLGQISYEDLTRQVDERKQQAMDAVK
jgi:hypothetical protein